MVVTRKRSQWRRRLECGYRRVGAFRSACSPSSPPPSLDSLLLVDAPKRGRQTVAKNLLHPCPWSHTLLFSLYRGRCCRLHKQARCQPWLPSKLQTQAATFFCVPLRRCPILYSTHGVKCDIQHQSGAIYLWTTYFAPGLHEWDALLPLDCIQHRSSAYIISLLL